jgi:ABC-type glycerol-3-phosphate transport system substrate-binding protein
MIQNRTPMVSDDKQEALFNKPITTATGESTPAGLKALDFYTSFASPTKENYSWSATQPQDYDLFANGQLPMIIDYSFRVRDLAQKNPTLNFATTGLPQIAGTNQPSTLANVLVVGVPVVSRNQTAAWDFIKFLTQKNNALAYAHATGRPPARLDLLGAPGFDPRLAPFMAQLPIATTWYRNEVNKTNEIFKQAIDAVLAGQPLTAVIDRLTKQVTHILRNEDPNG